MRTDLDIHTAHATQSATCAHCGLAVPAALIDSNSTHQFCCPGCRAAYETIRSCGLEQYYKLRDALDGTGKSIENSNSTFESFDADAFHSLYVKSAGQGLLQVDLLLGGVSCAACVWLLEKLPDIVPGVLDAKLGLRDAVLHVVFDPKRVTLSSIARTISKLGYEPHPARGADKRELFRKEERRRLIELAAAGAIAGNLMLLAFALYAGWFGHMDAGYARFFRWISLCLGLISLAWPGREFFRGALVAIRTRSANLDLPIAMALIAGGAAGAYNVVTHRGEIYFDSLATLVFLLLVGRFLQFRQQRRADDAVELLFSMTPTTARRKVGEVVEPVPIESIRPGDFVEVRSGDLVPADGTIVAGRSSVDQSLLTGESEPVPVEAGATVAAGARNLGGVIDVRVDAVGESSRVGRLMKLVEAGVREKPPLVQFTDKVAGWFVVGVTLVSLACFAYWVRLDLAAAIDHTVALLIVTCPCVIGLITPLTVAMTIGRLAQENILVKSGAALERLAKPGAIVLDKTGTITTGRPLVSAILGDASALTLAAAVERRSTHPAARAIVDHAKQGSTSIPDAADVIETGDGGIVGTVNGRRIRVGSPAHMKAHGVSMPIELQTQLESDSSAKTRVCVAIDETVVAIALLADAVRVDSNRSIAELKAAGWAVSMLSGDHADVARAIARDIGIEEGNVEADASPERKLERIRSMERSKVVVMVGDGVNDAAALAAADVGVAVHGGAEASLAAADIYVARPGMSPLVQLVRRSAHMMRVVRMNLAVSVTYNVVCGTLAATGVLNPLWAAVIMPLSSATVLSLTIASIRKRVV